jgi:hypothetical protein
VRHALSDLGTIIGVLMFLWAGQQDGARRRRRLREGWRRHY